MDYIEMIDRFNFGVQNIIDNLEISELNCCLDHKDNIKRQAVEHLCQRFKDKHGQIDMLKIPICAECAQALCGDEWVLLYCIYCNRSQWIYRPMAKLQYGKDVHVVWMDICPWCSEVTDKYDDVK